VSGPLTGKVALVAGATRGAGRGTAVALGEAGATVYCTGRTTRKRRSEYDRPETIEETAEFIAAAGGEGIAVEVDHLQPAQVEALVQRIDAERGRLDLLVNDIWGAELLFEWDTPVWKHDLEHGLRILRLAIDTHLITSHFALPLLIREPGGLVVEMTDGTRDYNAEHYRVSTFYDLAKTAVIRLAFAQSKELAAHGCTAVALTPGWMRSEMMLDNYEVTEANWRDAAAKNPHFAAISETPRFVAAPSPPSPPTPTFTATMAARSPPGASHASTTSPISTGPNPTAGATSSKSRTRAARQTRPATAERGTRADGAAAGAPRRSPGASCLGRRDRSCRPLFGAEPSISSLPVRLIGDHSEKEEAMKYMLLIHQGTTPTPGSDEWESLSEDEQKAVYGAYQALNQTPGFTSGVQMQPPETATTVRVENGKTLTTDGPFVETKEALGGYCFFEADDLDAAIELASRIPAASMGGAIEVRPVVER
jgi:NAD(P)-dependent dehydrogenase (short-subunit alcohol dehydrogenase family)